MKEKQPQHTSNAKKKSNIHFTIQKMKKSLCFHHSAVFAAFFSLDW